MRKFCTQKITKLKIKYIKNFELLLYSEKIIIMKTVYFIKKQDQQMKIKFKNKPQLYQFIFLEATDKCQFEVQGWDLTHRVILYCRVIYLRVKNIKLLRVENVENFQKTLENSKSQKKVARYHLKNEFSTVDVSSNEFSTHQLYTLTSIYTLYCQH